LNKFRIEIYDTHKLNNAIEAIEIVEICGLWSPYKFKICLNLILGLGLGTVGRWQSGGCGRTIPQWSVTLGGWGLGWLVLRMRVWSYQWREGQKPEVVEH